MSTATSQPANSQSSRDHKGAPWDRWSPTRVILISTLGSALITLCFFAPRFWLWPLAGLPFEEIMMVNPEHNRAYHALQQLQEPWQRIRDPINRVIEWRLLWPVVAHYLGFSTWTYLALPFAGCLFALAATATIVWRATKNALPTMTATLFTATCSWFFVSTGWLAYFDSWLILALLLATFASSRITMFGAALLAPWIDERFILALPICLAVRAIVSPQDGTISSRALVRDGVILCAGIAPYLATRFGAEISGARATSTSYWAERPILPAPWYAMLWGAWNGLRLGWVLLVAACIVALRNRQHHLALVVVALALGLNFCVADDVSRSASVAVPAVVAVLLIAWRARNALTRRALPLLCAGNLVLPAYHVIASPGTSVAYQNVAILGLTAEMDRKKYPPVWANAATYSRRSRDHFQSRLTPRALAAAEVALRLNPNSAEALASRGIIFLLSGKPVEGAADLDRALQIAPDFYDARMQRAAFRQQAGDHRGALDDVRMALKYVPPDWPLRADAEKLERALSAQVGR